MEIFVRKLFQSSSDWRLLTPRMIREKYLAHTNQSSLDPEDKLALKTTVLKVASEFNETENEKAAGSEKTQENGSSEEEKHSESEGSIDNSSSDEDIRPVKKRKPRLEDSEEDSSNQSSDNEDVQSLTKVKSNKARKGKDASTNNRDFSKEKKKKSSVSEGKQKVVAKVEMPIGEASEDENDSCGRVSSDEDIKPTAKRKRTSSLEDSGEEKSSDLSSSEDEVPKLATGKSKTERLTKRRKKDFSQNNRSSPKRTKTKKVRPRQEEDSGEFSSSDDEVLKPTVKKVESPNIVKKRKEDTSEEENIKQEKDTINSPSSEDEVVKPTSGKTKGNKEKKSSGISSSDYEVVEPTTVKSKSKVSKKNKDSPPGNKTSKQEKVKTTKQVKSADPTKNSRVIQLEKIARTCKALPVGKRYRETFENCTSANERIRIIKKLLEDVGMEGQPSMEKAEEIKLKQEAAELDTGNIIQGGGHGRRNVRSRYATQEYEPSQVQTQTPARQKFSNLKGIIDSEESDSD